ncbi:MAG: tetratricopeptide repeat protein [bacterium]|nr:tetratricopeptide repeat protein [bacterium]
MNEVQFQLDRLLEVGRSAEARQLLEKAFVENPDAPEAHYYCARIACLEDDYDAAREHLESALSSDPKYQEARYLLFCVDLDMHRWAAAEQTIIELIREEPYNPYFLAGYGQVMLYTVNLGKASELAQEALRRDPENAEAKSLAVMVAAVRGDTDLAAENLAELIRRGPEDEATVRTLFYVLVEQKRNREALRVGQQLLRERPEDQNLVDAIIELRLSTHWVALPAYPMVRWGWFGAGSVWVVMIVGMTTIGAFSEVAGGAFATICLIYIVYSWTFPFLLRRWLQSRGV